MTKTYIKGLPYQGGKYKLLDQILPLFPENIDTFVDVFGGGGNVFPNVKADHVVYNEKCKPVVGMLQDMYIKGEFFISEVDTLIEEFKLDKENSIGYYTVRELYNSPYSKGGVGLFTLLCHSFSNQMRFNKEGEFNLPFGQRTFNPTLRKRTEEFINRLNSMSIQFENKDFRLLFAEFSTVAYVRGQKEDFFFYCDPPYSLSTATYNENGGWGKVDDKDLMESLDRLNQMGFKWAMSNVLEHKGMVNEELKEWTKKYNVHYLDYNYNNCNYQDKNKEHKTVEVLITNY